MVDVKHRSERKKLTISYKKFMLLPLLFNRQFSQRVPKKNYFQKNTIKYIAFFKTKRIYEYVLQETFSIYRRALGLVEESQGVTKRCHLSRLTNSALVYEPKCGGLSQWVKLYTRAQINFGDLTPYLTYEESLPRQDQGLFARSSRPFRSSSWSASSGRSPAGWCPKNITSCTDKIENQILLIYKEIQSGASAKSYMRKGFLIYEEMRK